MSPSDVDPTVAVPRRDPLLLQVIDGRYRLLERIGEGGVGAVYRGEHVGMGKAVAIKLLHSMFASQPDFRRRFEREARAASKLSHPACVSVLDFGDIGGQLYLAMEYAPGKLLADRLDEGPLSATEAILIARTLASALRHAHGLGIVHRDLKPANVMLLDHQSTGLPCKLLDFGLAKAEDERREPEQEPLTQIGMVFGTPGYISPEQAQGQAADARSDLYSLGTVMFHMLTGVRPFQDREAMELLRSHIQKRPPLLRAHLPSASQELERLVSELLEKQPGARPQTAGDVISRISLLPEFAIDRAGAGAGMLDPEPSKPLPPQAPAQRVSWREVVAGTLVAVLLNGSAIILSRAQTPKAAGLVAPWAAAVESSVRPTSEAVVHATNAHDLIRRLYCRDGLTEYEQAIALDPTVKARPEVLDDAIRCLRQSHRTRASEFIASRIGPTARARLQAILTDASQPPDVKKAAKQTLDRLDKRPTR